jgi:hypothetical protein
MGVERRPEYRGVALYWRSGRIPTVRYSFSGATPRLRAWATAPCLRFAANSQRGLLGPASVPARCCSWGIVTLAVRFRRTAVGVGHYWFLLKRRARSFFVLDGSNG